MMPTLADYWEAQRTDSDMFDTTGDSRHLLLSGHQAEHLLAQFGSPLYVYRPATAVMNLRRLRGAFEASWPEGVAVYYALKANPNPALCAALASEGAGADCMSWADLYGAALSGYAADRLVLNGSAKEPRALEAAAAVGAAINVDSHQDVDWLEQHSRSAPGSVRVRIRLKLSPGSLPGVTPDHLRIDGDFDEYLATRRWGFTPDAAVELVDRLRRIRNVDLIGYHFHYGRLTRARRYFELWAAALAAVIVSIAARSGFVPRDLDIGGGWPRARDAESGREGRLPEQIEDYASAVCEPLRAGLAPLGPLPRLHVEPGSYLCGNACVLLASVRGVKSDGGRSWAHLDASTTNHMPRLDAVRETHAVAPTTGLDRQLTQTYDVVGPTCFASRFRQDLLMPVLQAGEPIAILDAGMYAEVLANHFNGLDIPASVDVDGEQPSVVRPRQAAADWYDGCSRQERDRSASPTMANRPLIAALGSGTPSA